MKFLLQRLAQMVAVVLAVTFLCFAALNFLGDPLFNILGPIADENSGEEYAEVRAEARAEYNLDKPFPERYVRWVGGMVQGDFGRSFKNQTEVSTELSNRLPVTVFLMVYAQVLAVVIAVPWAVISAARAYRTVDKVSTVVSFGLLGIPVFALVVLLSYGIQLKWDPQWGDDSLFPGRYDDESLMSRLRSLAIPATALAIPLIAIYQRLLRTDLISTLQEDFIAVARAKGMSERHVLFRHALRPSLFSMLTVFGIQTGALIGGSIVVEQFFAIPGVGRALVEAIIRDDFPLVLGVVVVVSVIFVVVNFLVDLAYTFLDPRVKFDG
ncbi:MAG: ABC transporter permease [Acidimicrobiales bacterium]|nr:ABC transporter permease [Acidimicrobiia bacterium]NNC80952.1 ABC transporter permease [Acidimicrobiales bacterium]RZV47667.1 MAG: ABC transporter permease [Acidimicrobiales bacterium]